MAREVRERIDLSNKKSVCCTKGFNLRMSLIVDASSGSPFYTLLLSVQPFKVYIIILKFASHPSPLVCLS